MAWKHDFGKFTVLEKVLVFSVAVLCVLVLVLFVSFLSSNDDSVCTHPECVRAAIQILDSVDPSIDPCEDFYGFTCGNYIKKASTTGSLSILQELSQLTKHQLKDIVVEKRNNETDISKTLRAQRKFYRTCVNESVIEEEEDQTIFRLLDEVLGGWPLLKGNNWQDRTFDWVQATIRARKLGLYYQFFFVVDIYHNLTNDKSMLWIRPPVPIEISSFYWKEQTVDLMAEIAELLGSEYGVHADIQSTMYFAKQIEGLAEIYHNKSLPYTSSKRHNQTISSIDHTYVKIDWLNFLRNITGVALREDDTVMFDLSDYLTDFYYLLHRTPNRIRANFMAWAIISSNINYMTKKVRSKYDELPKFFNSTEKTETSRSDICFKLSTGLFRSIAESEYMRRYTPPEKKSYISKMIESIKREMDISLTVTPWLDKFSRANSLERLRNISGAIGWLDVAFNVDKLDQLNGYHKMVFNSENVVDMARTVTRINYENYYRQLRRNITDLERLGSPNIEVNAYFVRYYNILVLPASIIQGHLFNRQRPRYLNYGALGTIIGHELTHGFEGVMEFFNSNVDALWTNGTIDRFTNVSECLVNEYEDFRKEIGTWQNESTVQANAAIFHENLADFTGINLAYTAYRRWAELHSAEKTLPGVRYTPKQLFWIMSSMYMCHGPKLAEEGAFFKRGGLHGEPNFRVVGRLRHSPYFAEDFGCSLDSKMNVRNKCRVYW